MIHVSNWRFVGCLTQLFTHDSQRNDTVDSGTGAEDMINETSAAHQLIVVVMAAKAGIQNVVELLRKRNLAGNEVNVLLKGNSGAWFLPASAKR
jgi:hypothetical protein